MREATLSSIVTGILLSVMKRYLYILIGLVTGLIGMFSIHIVHADASETVSGNVFEDLNHNGSNDSEPGIEGLQVQLFRDSEIDPVGTVYTNSSGFYLFDNNNADIVPENAYTVMITPPTWSTLAITTGAISNPIAIIHADDAISIPLLGIARQSSISGQLFYDTNNNGIRDVGEGPITNINVVLCQITSEGGVSCDNTFTDDTGHYHYDITTDAYYYILFNELPIYYRFTQSDQGSDDSIDSDVSYSGQSPYMLVENSAQYNNIDAGAYVTDVGIGGRVWDDQNHDGIQQSGEPGIEDPAEIVMIDKQTNLVIGSGSTDSDGHYQFSVPNTGCLVPNFQSSTGAVSLSYDCPIADFGGSGGITLLNFTTGGDCTANNTTITLTDTDGSELFSSTCTNSSGGLNDHESYREMLFGSSGIPGTMHLVITSDTPIINISNMYWTYKNTKISVRNLNENPIFSPSNAGIDDTIDSDIDATGNLDPFNSPAGVSYDHLDAGVYYGASHARLVLRLSSDVSAHNIETFHYFLSVENQGPDEATSILVQYIPPTGILFTNPTGSGSYILPGGQWIIPSIAPGDSATLSITATLIASSGTIINTAEIVSALSTDPEPISHIYGDGIDQDDLKSVSFTIENAGSPSGSSGGGSSIVNPSGVEIGTRSVTQNSSSTSTTTTTQCLQVRSTTPLDFLDVVPSNSDIDYLSSITLLHDKQKRLVSGYKNQQFLPARNLSRFELLKLSLTANCISKGVFTHPNHFFTDVPQDNSEQSMIIGEAYFQGIVHGIGNKFYPNQAVSLAESIKMLVGSSIFFSNGQVIQPLPIKNLNLTDQSFGQYIAYSQMLKIMPNSALSFLEKATLNRQSMATMLKKYIEAMHTSVVVS